MGRWEEEEEEEGMEGEVGGRGTRGTRGIHGRGEEEGGDSEQKGIVFAA